MTTITTNTPILQPGALTLGMNDGWEAVLEAYLAQKDCMDASKLTYRKGLTQYFNWLNETGRSLNRIEKQDIIQWKRELSMGGHSVKTIKLYITSVKGFYDWTSTTRNANGQIIYPNVTKELKAVRSSQDGDAFIKMHLTEEQGGAFLKYFKDKADGKKDSDLRNYAMMNLMIRTGLRSVEVSRADIGDVSSKGGRRVLRIQGKGKLSKNDFVVLTDAAYGPLEEYLCTRPDDGFDEPLFSTCRQGKRLSPRTIQFIGKEGMRAVGLDDHEYSVHSLRHTAGVQILLNGGTQFDVQDVLRHASPVTSQIYLESIKEDRRLKEAPESLLDKSFNV